MEIIWDDCMRILAYITKIEAKDEFFVVTAKDVRKRDHSLFFQQKQMESDN